MNKILTFFIIMLVIFSFDYLILVWTNSLTLNISYLDYLRNGLMGDWGPTLRYEDKTVIEALFANWQTTIILLLSSFFISNIIATLLALFIATKWGKVLDFPINITTYILVCTPVIISAPIMIHQFIFSWNWGDLQAYTFPIIVLTLSICSLYFKYLRLGLLESLDKSFIAAAYAKGLSSTRILIHYALRDGLGTFLSIIPSTLVQLFSMVIAVEYIFDLPGMGRFAIQSALNRDYPVVLGMINITVILTYIMTLLVEFLQIKLVPKLRMKHVF